MVATRATTTTASPSKKSKPTWKLTSADTASKPPSKPRSKPSSTPKSQPDTQKTLVDEDDDAFHQSDPSSEDDNADFEILPPPFIPLTWKKFNMEAKPQNVVIGAKGFTMELKAKTKTFKADNFGWWASKQGVLKLGKGVREVTVTVNIVVNNSSPDATEAAIRKSEAKRSATGSVSTSKTKKAKSSSSGKKRKIAESEEEEDELESEGEED